jgi:hypothetical protein
MREEERACKLRTGQNMHDNIPTTSIVVEFWQRGREGVTHWSVTALQSRWSVMRDCCVAPVSENAVRILSRARYSISP